MPYVELTDRSRGPVILTAIERGIGWVVASGAVLALPLSVLLFLQWPLRDIVGIGSREANDLAQVLFALYVSVGITAATRQDTHLAVDVVAARYPNRVRRILARASAILIVVPWTSFVLYAAWPTIMQSLNELERFPDTYNPGYFILKIGVGLLALLALAQAIITAFTREQATV